MTSVFYTPYFERQIKKLHKNQISDLNNAIRTLIKNPLTGEKKKGDLSEIHVYKFRMCHQLTLLAYKALNEKEEIHLLDIGSHENFYRDLKNRLFN